MYQVLARKWRPQNFDELVGQQRVAQTLSNAIESNRLAHAYIFAGLRGTGKTTVARILAKCLNCEKGPSIRPCGECAACLEIADSSAMDVMEIDAASRTKVEQTRELLEIVSYAPVRDRYKILIIDEAHMLSKNSFNALLKTLEEPPPNVIFLLATTELHKILPTILSRCQVFEFRRVGVAEVATHLKKICVEEKVAISAGALERIARAGEGSVRDSLSLLERVLAFCGTEVGDEEVLRILGAVEITKITELMEGLGRRDAGVMLSVLDELVEEGHDLIHFWQELIGALRDLLLSRSLPDREDLLSRPPEDAAALAGAAADLSREDLTRAFQILADLELPLRSSSQPRFLFEATLIRLASLGAVRPIEELLKGSPRPARTPAAAPRPRPTPPTAQKKSRAEPAAPPPATGEMAGDVVAALRSQLEPEAGRLAGRKLKLRVELAAADPSPAEPAATAAPKPAPGTTGPAAPDGDLLDQARSEPGVRKLLDIFGAQVVDIRSGRKGKGARPVPKAPHPLKESP